jgi:hypothetical protein
MPVMLGGAKARGQHILGDVVVSFQYVNDEPAMTLWSLRSAQNAGAYVVCLSSAFKYLDQPYLIQQAYKACEVMGTFPTRDATFKIATIIFDHLEELVRMRPEQEDEKVAIGEGSIVAGDGSKVHFELTE